MATECQSESTRPPPQKSHRHAIQARQNGSEWAGGIAIDVAQAEHDCSDSQGDEHVPFSRHRAPENENGVPDRASEVFLKRHETDGLAGVRIGIKLSEMFSDHRHFCLRLLKSHVRFQAGKHIEIVAAAIFPLSGTESEGNP